MAESYPTDSALEALSGGTGDSGIPHMTIGESPHYHNKLRRSDWLDRILLTTAAALRVYKDDAGALLFGVTAGRFQDASNERTFAAAGAQALTDDATNYIYLEADGDLIVNTTGFPNPATTAHIPLAAITTAAGAYDLDDIVDHRGRAIFSVLRG